MSVVQFPTEVDLDDDGYPSEEWLERLRYADDIPRLSSWLIDTFPKVVNAIGYGSVSTYKGNDDWGGPIHVVHYSTGGWSGQEALIDVVSKGIIGMMYLHSWRRGGHYEFRVPVGDKS